MTKRFNSVNLRTKILLVLLLGVLIRFIPVAKVNFGDPVPFGMGGFYFKISQEILKNNWSLPEIIPHYTTGGVPYAYPPLTFYILAFLSKITSLKPFILVSTLPAIFSSLTLWAFYHLATQIFKDQDDKSVLLIATLIYALIPASFVDLLPAEGLVESLGTLTYIWGLYFLIKISRDPSWENSLIYGILIGLNTLASPGGFFATIIIIPGAWLFSHNKRSVALKLILAIALGALVSMPYWNAVRSTHSSGIFLDTLLEQFTRYGAKSVKSLLWLKGTSEQYLTVWGVFTLIGIPASLLQGNLFTTVWLILTYLVPREFEYLIAIPMAILCTYSLKTLLEGIKSIIQKPLPVIGKVDTILLTLCLIFVYSTAQSVKTATDLPRKRTILRDKEIAMMDWIRDNTSPETAFLVLGNELEWFPAITERTTVNAIYGAEWEEDDTVYHAQQKIRKCRKLVCISATAEKYGLIFDYLYITNNKRYTPVIDSAKNSHSLKLVKENAHALLFYTQ